MAYEIVQAQASLDRNTCEVKWNDGHVSRYHCQWLRFNCHCKRCWPTVSGVCMVDILSFPENLSIDRVEIYEKGNGMNLSVKGEILSDHVTKQPAHWLRANCYCNICLENKVHERDVFSKYKEETKSKPKVVPYVDYSAVLNDEDRGLFEIAKNVIETGFCVVSNVPQEKGMVVEVGKKFATIRWTIDRELFNVCVTKNVNSACTTLGLPMHQDMQVFETAPGVQLLHTLKFDSCISGGESALTDMFQAAETLRQESPRDFQTFLEVPGSWAHCRDEPVFWEHQKKHIVLDYFGQIVGINWHPGLATTNQIRGEDMDRYYSAYRKFAEILKREENHFQFRLKPGDLLIMNNRRMGHSRKAFQLNGGDRHLQGTYLNIGDFRSKYLSLAHKLGINVVTPKVGNSSSF